MSNEQIAAKPEILKGTAKSRSARALDHLRTVIKIIIFIFLAGFIPRSEKPLAMLTGAWQLKSDSSEEVMIFQDGYFTHTDYNKTFGKFNYTRGGTVNLNKDSLFVTFEFHSDAKDQVGQTLASKISFSEGKMVTNWNGVQQKWTRADKGEAPLAGYWRINGRMQAGKMVEIKPRARKTIKVLSGTRFQWAAINTETKEFFGTGGGTYTFTNGKYTENIEFFSRDSSRIGARLVFDAKVENGVWHHSGSSSQGDPIHETWIKFVH